MYPFSIRNSYRIKNKLTLFLNQYKIVILICLLMLVLGATLGVFTVIKYSDEIELSNLSDVSLVEFLKGNKSVTGIFFPYMFAFLFYVCVIIYFNFKPILSICSYLLLIVRGYLIGFDIAILIMLYGLAGVLNVIIILIPFELIVWLVLIVIAAIAIKRNYNMKKFGETSCCNPVGFKVSKTYIFLVIVGCLSLFFKCLLMPFMRVTIIVN